MASPSLEETCDIVLPPPEESLYTLPRRKTIHTGHVSDTNNQTVSTTVTQPPSSNSKLETDPGFGHSNAILENSVDGNAQFETTVISSNSLVQQQTQNSNRTGGSNLNKAPNGPHSESSVWWFVFIFENHFVCDYIAKFVRHEIVEQKPWVLKYTEL